jgi:hypothetical protein
MLFSSVLGGSPSYADPVDLNKGQPAPFTGILFTPEDDKKLRDMYIEKEALEKKFTYIQEDNKLLLDKSKLWQDQSEVLSKRLVEAQNDSFWKKSMFFALGVIATVGAAYAVKGATR